MLLGAGVVVLLLFLILGRGDVSPIPEITPDELGPNQQEAVYTEFAGTVFNNGSPIELENIPLIVQGLLYLPVLEMAQHLDIQVIRGNDDIFIGQSVDVEPADTPRVFYHGAEVTPASLITSGDDFYIQARELAPLLDLNFYENLFANAAYLGDELLPTRDGDYAAVLARDKNGWAPELRISIENGIVTAVEYVELDEEGNNKFDNQDYLDTWQDVNPEIDPIGAITQLEEQLLANQSIADVDVTTGATGSWKNFRKLSSIILGKAKFDAIPIHPPDGEYVAVGNPSERGWTPVIEFAIENGNITEFIYDEVDAEGNSKRADEGYVESWRNAYSEIDPIAIISEREQDLLRTQDPNLIDATTGATSWGINIKQYTTGALDHIYQATPPVEGKTYIFFGETNARGDHPQLLLVVDGGIHFADFSDYRNGIPKKIDEPYMDQWQEQYPEVDPIAVLAEMEQRFVETEDPDALDGISGATSWRDSFQALATRAIDFLEK